MKNDIYAAIVTSIDESYDKIAAWQKAPCEQSCTWRQVCCELRAAALRMLRRRRIRQKQRKRKGKQQSDLVMSLKAHGSDFEK